VIALAALWTRRLWPCLALAAILAGAFALGRSSHGRPPLRASAAHQATISAEQYVYRTDTVY
jgi:hypothetical protein